LDPYKADQLTLTLTFPEGNIFAAESDTDPPVKWLFGLRKTSGGSLEIRYTETNETSGIYLGRVVGTSQLYEIDSTTIYSVIDLAQGRNELVVVGNDAFVTLNGAWVDPTVRHPLVERGLIDPDGIGLLDLTATLGPLVPEPGMLALAGFGVSAVLARRGRRRSIL
jgi:hypothetical protein